jgi:methionine-rich copper-binding protein CopC
MRKALLAAIVTPFLLLAGGEAAAHAFLDHAEPAVGSTVATPPSEVVLTFTRKLDPASCTIEITDGASQRIDAAKPDVTGTVMRVALAPLPPGTYRVKWRVRSADGHVTDGAFTFQIRP